MTVNERHSESDWRASIERRFDRMEENLSAALQHLAAIRSREDERQSAVTRFWDRDWPGLLRRLEHIDGRVTAIERLSLSDMLGFVNRLAEKIETLERRLFRLAVILSTAFAGGGALLSLFGPWLRSVIFGG